MGRRGKLNFTSLFFFKPSINGGGGGGGGGDTTPSSSSSSSSSLSTSSWAWPSCKQAPRTDSFRSGPAVSTSNVMFKTVNSVYFDSTDAASFFSTRSSTASDDDGGGSLSADVESEEAVIRGLVRSDRLLFEPGGNKSSSILTSTRKDDEGEEYTEPVAFALKESVAMAVESSDPYGDFRRSMEEMVAAHGAMARSWECLEELLVWYLRLNGKKNHGLIVAAFVDLLVNLAATSASASASASASDSNEIHEIKDAEGDVVASSSTSNSSSDSNSNSNSPTSSSVSFEIQEEGSGSC